jgi:PAS domain S-box-containing protein
MATPQVLWPLRWPDRPLGPDLLLAFGLYAVLAYGCIVVARQPGTIAVIWLANGVATALLVSTLAAATLRRTALMLLAGMAGNLVANLAYGDPWSVSLAFLLPNAAEVLLGATLLRASRSLATFAHEPFSLLRVLAAGALIPPLAGATVGAALLQALGFASFDRVWLDWYIGAALGSAATLPLVLSLRSTQAPRAWATLFAPRPTLLLALVPLLVLAVLQWAVYPFVVLTVLMLLLALSVPRQATLLAAPLMVATLGVALATGRFLPLSADDAWGHAQLYFAVLLVVLAGQIAAVMGSRQRALDEMLSAVAGRTDVILLFADLNGVCRWVSRSREVYRGLPNSAVLGRSLAELLGDGQFSHQAVADFEQVLEGEKPVARVVEIDYPLMGRRVMSVQVLPAYDDEKRLIGAISVAYDITERESQARELVATAARLQASNEGLQQFVRIASHDLREPMITIEQFVGLIEAGPARALDDDGRQWFALVRSGAARLRRILDDVLQFVRLDEIDPTPPQPVDLDALLAEVRQALHAQAAAAGATVVVEAPLGSVPGRPALLGLLLQNLLSNAFKFVAPGVAPRVQVAAWREPEEGGWLTLEVKDNGIGIEPQRLPELGQPFKRLHARRRYDGTGLGLAICQRIVQQHGGQLQIESAPGQGSVFRVRLPLNPTLSS